MIYRRYTWRKICGRMERTNIKSKKKRFRFFFFIFLKNDSQLYRACLVGRRTMEGRKRGGVGVLGYEERERRAVWMNGWMNKWMNVYICLYIYIYICVCVCLYVSIYVRVHIRGDYSICSYRSIRWLSSNVSIPSTWAGYGFPGGPWKSKIKCNSPAICIEPHLSLCPIVIQLSQYPFLKTGNRDTWPFPMISSFPIRSSSQHSITSSWQSTIGIFIHQQEKERTRKKKKDNNVEWTSKQAR